MDKDFKAVETIANTEMTNVLFAWVNEEQKNGTNTADLLLAFNLWFMASMAVFTVAFYDAEDGPSSVRGAMLKTMELFPGYVEAVQKKAEGSDEG